MTKALPFALFVALTLVLALHHEPWRDEADSWLYARDADPLTIASRLRYMGTPGLWYALLFPIAKPGLPYETQAYLHLGLAWAAAALFTWYSPFPLLLRLAFLFSYFISYEYAVVARSYALTVLLLFAAASFYPIRFTRPLLFSAPVALLFHANAHSLGVAASLAAVYMVEAVLLRVLTLRALIGVALMSASALLSVLSLATPPDPNILPHAVPQAQAVPLSLGTAFLPGQDPWVATLVAVGVLVLAALTIAPRPDALAFLTLASLWLGYVFVYRYVGSARHHGLFLIVLVAALWIARSRSDPRRNESPRVLRGAAYVALGATLAVSFLYAADRWRLELNRPYSGAAEMAAFLRDHQLTDRTIAAHPAPHTESVLPYLPGVRFWYLGIQEFGTYMLWDETYRHGEQLPLGDALARLPSIPGGPFQALLLVNAPLPEPYAAGYLQLYSTRLDVFAHQDERFYLYAPIGATLR